MSFAKKGQLKSGSSAPHSFYFLTDQGEISQLLWAPSAFAQQASASDPEISVGLPALCKVFLGKGSPVLDTDVSSEEKSQTSSSAVWSFSTCIFHRWRDTEASQAQLSLWLLRSCACICCDKWSSDFWQQKLSAFQYCSFLGLRTIRLWMPWAADLTGLSADVPTESLPITVTS